MHNFFGVSNNMFNVKLLSSNGQTHSNDGCGCNNRQEGANILIVEIGA